MGWIKVSKSNERNEHKFKQGNLSKGISYIIENEQSTATHTSTFTKLKKKSHWVKKLVEGKYVLYDTVSVTISKTE